MPPPVYFGPKRRHIRTVSTKCARVITVLIKEQVDGESIKVVVGLIHTSASDFVVGVGLVPTLSSNFLETICRV